MQATNSGVRVRRTQSNLVQPRWKQTGYQGLPPFCWLKMRSSCVRSPLRPCNQPDTGPLQARCAEEARRLLFAQGDVHLLITDVVLPDANGVNLASELRNRRPGLKTILISRYPEGQMHRAGLPERDFHYYLSKPFSSESLTAKIKEVLGESEGISK